MYRKGARERESLATLPSAAASYPIVGRCVQKAMAGFRRLYVRLHTLSITINLCGWLHCWPPLLDVYTFPNGLRFPPAQ